MAHSFSPPQGFLWQPSGLLAQELRANADTVSNSVQDRRLISFFIVYLFFCDDSRVAIEFC